jgi:hypothetical protein
MLATLGKLLAKKKGWLLGGVPVGAYIYSRLKGDDKSDEDIRLKTEQPAQPQTQTKQQTSKSLKAKHTTPQHVQQQETSTSPEQESTTVGAFLPELAKLYQLSGLLALQYEQDAKTYYNIYQTYSEKLEKIIPVMTMMLAKTPLSQITTEDLPDKLFTMFKYYSWDFSTNNFPKVLQGYYLIKANGGDTSNLTITDLIVASENPALAEGVNENFVKVLSNIAEVYKLNMQSALDQIGKLKDIYNFRLNTLKAQADMINGIIKAIADEEKNRFDRFIKMWNTQINEFKARTHASYEAESLRLREQQMQLKQQNQIPINIQTSKEKK